MREIAFNKWWEGRKSKEQQRLIDMGILLGISFEAWCEQAFYAGLDEDCTEGSDCPCYQIGLDYAHR